jgi:hypothetical protein
MKKQREAPWDLVQVEFDSKAQRRAQFNKKKNKKKNKKDYYDRDDYDNRRFK